MKIRTKISLWITGAGLCASLVFSAVIFFEMVEEPLEIVDEDLAFRLEDMVHISNQCTTEVEFINEIKKLPNLRRYWIRLVGDGGIVLWQTELGRLVDIPENDRGGPYTVKLPVPITPTASKLVYEDATTLRIVTRQMQIADRLLTVRIGKPMEDLDAEIVELLLALAVGLAAAFAFLAFTSYLIAGRILKPVGEMNRLAKEIDEKTLSKRIPVGGSPDELNQLAASLNRMFDRLQYSFERQRRFIADASHEMKSPVALLRLIAEEGLQRKDLPEPFVEDLVRQYDLLNRLSRLVNDLLNLSALELGTEIRSEPFLVEDLLSSIVEDYKDLFSERGIRASVRVPRGLCMTGDREKIRRALVNLMDNAVKYNRENGEVRLTATTGSRFFRISVYDTGMGIPPEEIGHVFEQFYRVEKSRSLEFGGAGLGLTIVKRIVAHHGGEVSIESEPSQWTRVTLSFPSERLLKADGDPSGT
jgi:signal transduction histidine kinase